MIDWQDIVALQEQPLWEDRRLLDALDVVEGMSDEVTPEAVAVAIHNATLTYAMSRYRAQVKPSVAEEEARAVADACRKLLAACSGKWRTKEGRASMTPDQLRQSLGAGGLFAMANSTGQGDGRTSVMNVLRGVAMLEQWADGLAARHQSKPKQSQAHRPKNEALPYLFDTLEQIYMTAWEDWPALNRTRLPATIRHECPPDRFLLFLCEVFPVIAGRGIDVGEVNSVAIEQAARRYRKDIKERGLAPFWHQPLSELTK